MGANNDLNEAEDQCNEKKMMDQAKKSLESEYNLHTRVSLDWLIKSQGVFYGRLSSVKSIPKKKH